MLKHDQLPRYLNSELRILPWHCGATEEPMIFIIPVLCGRNKALHGVLCLETIRGDICILYINKFKYIYVYKLIVSSLYYPVAKEI